MNIQINKHIDYFVKYVVSKDNQECFLSFKNSPFLKTQEGYKDSIAADFTKAFNKLNFHSKDVGSGKLLSMVKQQLLSTQNNLVFVNQKIHFNNVALEKPNEVELFLYQLYYLHDDENSFETAVKLFGGKYDLIAFLFFVKDSMKYLPVNSGNFDERFRLLNIDFKMSSRCNWDNYNQYLGIMNDIKLELRHSLLDDDISLLNAHSFVWIAGNMYSDDSVTMPKQEKHVTTIARIGQNFFRADVLNYWDNQCPLTNCKNTRFLSAAHIKPWHSCETYDDSVNPYNGLLLTPNLHEAFDLGLISFDEKGKILISKEFERADYQSLGIDPSMKLRKIESAHLPFLQYHRENIFKQ